jgi:hypothetical protein
MNKPRPDSVQVSSDQIDGRLATIEDRLAGVEAILAHANRKDVEELVASAIGGSAQRKRLLQLCETPRSIPELVAELKLNSGQALNNHLRPLRDNSLLQHASTQPEVTYEWSSLLRRLPKAVREKLLK